MSEQTEVDAVNAIVKKLVAWVETEVSGVSFASTADEREAFAIMALSQALAYLVAQAAERANPGRIPTPAFLGKLLASAPWDSAAERAFSIRGLEMLERVSGVANLAQMELTLEREGESGRWVARMDKLEILEVGDTEAEAVDKARDALQTCLTARIKQARSQHA